MPKQVVDPTYAKFKEYRQVIETIADKGKCPFCPENFKYHKNPILKEEPNWFVTKNSWPYKHCQYHFLILCRQHKENFSQLTVSDLKQVQQLVNWTIAKFKIKGGGLTFRFGETKYTGATVCHLHFHLIVPQLDKKKQRAQTVTFPIG